MDKSLRFKLFVIASVISLLMLLITFFELDRFLYCQFSSIESYIAKYKDVPSYKGGKRIVISLTTTPETVKNLNAVVKSLLDQTVRVNEIALNIPYKMEIPTSLEKVVTIFRTGKQVSPLDGILPTVKREGERGTIIIALNDKYVYSKDFIEKLMEESDKNPQSSIYINSDETLALYKPEFVKPDILYTTTPPTSIVPYLMVGRKGIDYNYNYRV